MNNQENGVSRVGCVLFVVYVAVMAFLTACSPTTAPDPTLAGTYALVAFNGHEVPHVVIADSTGTNTVTSGTLTLDATGTFAEVTVQVVRFTTTRARVDSLRVETTRSGTWSARGDRIAFRLADGSGWDGTRDAAGLRYAAAGQRFAWGRP
jgi:hypothetical protein